MASPSVSVLIVNWNRGSLLQACLQSLTQQSFKNFETIVVDNGSMDGSGQLVRDKFPEVCLIPLENNLGFSAANNIGIRQARGKYIALLNNDTEVDPDWLEELVQVLETRKEIGFCASMILLHDRRDLADTCGDFYNIAGAGGKIGHLQKASSYNRPLEVFGACAGAAIYRRELLEELGGFDEDFFLAHEDTDLSFRAQLRGYRCLYVPTAVVYHRLHASLGQYSPKYVYYGHRNLEYAYIKNMPLLLLLITLPLHLLDVFLSFCFFLAKGRGLSFLKAKWDVLRVLPHLIRKRRAIQRARTVPISSIASILAKNWPALKIRGLVRRGWR